MRICPVLLAALSLLLATPATAQLRPLVDPPATAAAAQGGIDIYLINEGTTPVPADGPADIETMARDGSRLRLIAAPEAPLTVPPGGFVRVHYRLAAIAAPSPAGTAIIAEAAPDAHRVAPAATRPADAPRESASTDSSGTASGFLDRFRAHEPIYGAFGLNDAGAKLQFSLAFRALGRDEGPHLNVAYTQTMFWALNQPSGPFRATNYSPEVYADVPLDRSTIVGVGYAHTSNGLGAGGSIDVNRIFIRATKTVALGDGWELALTPQAWFYVGTQGVAPDLERYWGYSSLRASIGQQDGLKFTVTGRGNVERGRGAAEAFLSYPLTRVSHRLPQIYIFGQVFTGYGEALTDYDKADTHARIGIAFTR